MNRALLNQMFPAGTLTRNTGTVQYDHPTRQMPRSTQVSFGYERQVGQTMSLGVDYVRNRGRNWVGFDLNPGLRVNTTRTGQIVRTDLFGLASQLGIAPDYTGETRYDGLNLQAERRFAGFWSARASYTLGHARGNNGGASLATNNFQVLGEWQTVQHHRLERRRGPQRHPVRSAAGWQLFGHWPERDHSGERRRPERRVRPELRAARRGLAIASGWRATEHSTSSARSSM